MRKFLLVIVFISSISLLTNASAESDPKDVIKYRHSVMEAMANHMGALLLIAQGKVDAANFMQGHADALANGADALDGMFPAGTGGGETKALPAIWEDPDGFAKAIAEIQSATDGLQEAAATGDTKQVFGAFARVGKSCKGCHEGYREED